MRLHEKFASTNNLFYSSKFECEWETCYYRAKRVKTEENSVIRAYSVGLFTSSNGNKNENAEFEGKGPWENTVMTEPVESYMFQN